MSRPLIGITSELEAARWGDWLREAVVSPVSYTRAVERAGAAPVVLPPVPSQSVQALAAGLDGLVFTGGRDLNPELYEQQRLDQTDPPDQRRDRFELALMRAAIDAGLPFLAIGRGLHVLTVALGGTLTQDLPGHRTGRARYLPHDVRLTGDTLLSRLLGGAVQAPAAHHQAPSRIGSRLAVAGWSPDNEIVEALEVTGHRFGVGVHWHPEEGDDPRLLTALVEAAARQPAERQARQESTEQQAGRDSAGQQAEQDSAGQQAEQESTGQQAAKPQETPEETTARAGSPGRRKAKAGARTR